MEDGKNIGVAVPNNVISQNPTKYTIKLDVYDKHDRN